MNPKLQAHVWNEAISPALESTTSPMGLEMGIMAGGLRGAAAFSTAAKVAYKAIPGLFGAQAAWSFANQAPETYHVLKDPNSSFDDVGKALARQAADGTFAILGGLGMIESVEGAEGLTLKDLARQQPTPAEAVKILRAKAAIAKPEEAAAFHVAADAIEDHTAPTTPAETVSVTQPPPSPEKKDVAVPSTPHYADEPAKSILSRLISKVADMQALIGKTDKTSPKGLREQDRLGREDAAAIRKELLDVASKLPFGERGRFTAAITDAMNRPAIGYSPEGMYQRAMHVMFRMQDRFDQVERAALIDEINASVKKALDSPSVDIIYKQRIQKALGRTAFKTLSDEKRARLMATRDFIARGGEVPEDIEASLDMLSQTPAKELPMSVLEGLRDKVELLSKLGRTVVKSRQALYDGTKERLSSDLRAGEGKAIDETAIKVSPGQKLTALQAASQDIYNRVVTTLNWAGKVGRSLLARDVIMDMMDNDAGYKGGITRIFGRTIDLNYNAEMNLRRAFNDPVENLLKRQSYTSDEAVRVGIYATLQQEGGRQRLLDSGVTERVIEHTSNTITPKELELYHTMRGVFDKSSLPALQNLMRSLYNVEVKPVKDYFPFQRDHNLVEPGVATASPKADSGQAVGFDEMATWKELQGQFTSPITTKAEKGMTIERSEGATGAIKLNALEVFDSHVRQTAHLLANQRDLKMLGEIARQDWFKQKYGRMGQDYILKLLDTVARDAAPSGATRSAMIDWLTRNTSVGVIGLRVLSQLKHLPNMAFSLANVKPNHLVNGMVESMTPEGREFIQKNFAEIAQRQGGEPAIADLSNGSIWRKIQSGSFVVEKALDAIDARATVLGRYMQELEAKGLDPKQYATLPVDRDAQGAALNISRQTVTSPLRKDVPQAISRGTLTGNNMSYARALFQFQNTVLRQMGYLKHDIYDLGLRKLNVHQFTFATLAFTAMLAGESAIVEANKKLFGLRRQGKDKDSFAEEMAAELLRRIPFAGNIAAAAIYGESGIPLADTAIQGTKSAYHAATGKNDFGGKMSSGQKKKETATALGVAGEVLGVPGASTATQIYKARLPKRDIDTSLYPH